MRTANITIHSDNLRHNVDVICAKACTAKLLAMVKANAYGHGVDKVVPILHRHDKVQGFGVATLAEGVSVRALTDKPIVLVEGVFSQAEWQVAKQHNMMCVVHCKEQLDWAVQDTNDVDVIWLKYNTGMNRLGFGDDEILDIAKQLHGAGYQLILMTHFACADEACHPLTKQQIDKFEKILAQIRAFAPTTQGSLCNSAGIFNTISHHDWVRAGIALYGASFGGVTAWSLNLKPVMSLSSKIMAIHHLKSGESVGYGALWVAQEPCKIGIVSIGYGDGYPRVVQGAWVAIRVNGKVYRSPIVGRVAMDMLMVELSDVPNVQIGDEVILWGDGDGVPSIDEIAECAGTIGYELACRLTTRANRLLV